MPSTDDSPKPTKRPRTRAPKPDGRANNKGVVGNKGNRTARRNNPLWKPAIKEVETSRGVWRKQTPEEAMEDARALVAHYAACGFPQHVIAKMMTPELSEDTLIRHFKNELDNGSFMQLGRIRGTLYAAAVSGRDMQGARWLADRLERKLGLAPTDGGSAAPLEVHSIPGDDGL